MEKEYALLRAYIGRCNNQGLREAHFDELDLRMRPDEKARWIVSANRIIDKAFSDGGVRFDGIAPCHNLGDYRVLVDYLGGQGVVFEEKRILKSSFHGILIFIQGVIFPDRKESDRDKLLDLFMGSPLKPESLHRTNERFRLSERRCQWSSNLYFLDK